MAASKPPPCLLEIEGPQRRERARHRKRDGQHGERRTRGRGHAAVGIVRRARVRRPPQRRETGAQQCRRATGRAADRDGRHGGRGRGRDGVGQAASLRTPVALDVGENWIQKECESRETSRKGKERKISAEWYENGLKKKKRCNKFCAYHPTAPPRCATNASARRHRRAHHHSQRCHCHYHCRYRRPRRGGARRPRQTRRTRRGRRSAACSRTRPTADRPAQARAQSRRQKSPAAE